VNNPTGVASIYRCAFYYWHRMLERQVSQYLTFQASIIFPAT